MSTSELDSRNIAISMRKSVENLVISSQDAIGQSISQALTFSGVITQQAHQMMQETRNVSRSPSPSLRNSEGPDSLENDKQGEMAIHVPSHPAGDTVSVSSASDLASLAPANKSDKGLTSTPNPYRGMDPSARVKKKSWYTSLYPTYKSKSDDFKRLFKDLPDDERLIVDYSCALQKDILAHGRLYASQNYLCFYASIFGWETSMSLRWKEVTAITKEKTALVIPNAILVCTEGEKNFLTSFSGRDKAYLMLFRIWQNALMDQPMTSQEIWQWVHSCYGEELGFGSEDEGYSRELSLPTDPLPHIDGHSELDLVDSSMEAVGGADARDDRSRGGSRSGSRSRDSPPLVTNGDTGWRGGGVGGEAGGEGDTLPTDMSDTSDSEDKPNSATEKCTSEHSGKVLMRGQFPFNIDQLFTMIFTSSKFNLELLAARGTKDYIQAPWDLVEGVKCRQVSYVLGLTSGPIGPKEVHVTETQVMNKCSKPGHLYSIDSSSENRGIPYADYFTVEAHYCLSRVTEHTTHFSLLGQVKYKKSMWPMVKAFLEKNAMSGLEDFGRLLEAKLASEGGHVPAVRSTRRHHRHHVSSLEAPVAASRPPPVAALAPRAPLPRAPPPPAAGPWLALALLLLLVLNCTLYYKLYYSQQDDLATRIKTFGAEQSGDWSTLLDADTRRQRGELLAWRDALDATVQHLHQTEQALRKLIDTIEPSLKPKSDESNPSEDTDTQDSHAKEDADPRAHAPPEDKPTRNELLSSSSPSLNVEENLEAVDHQTAQIQRASQPESQAGWHQVFVDFS